MYLRNVEFIQDVMNERSPCLHIYDSGTTNCSPPASSLAGKGSFPLGSEEKQAESNWSK